MSTLRILLALLALTLAAGLRAAEAEMPQTGRVVAFGDVHGAYDELAQLLQETGVIDATGNWSGGNTQLVSLGDILDRGPDSRKVLELLMRLEEQAAAAGGSVHVVLGNHETMVMSGDLGYVSAGEYAAFAAEEDAAEREKVGAAYLAARPQGDPATVQAEFARKYPPGRLALQRAFSPEGRYGKWLLGRPVVVRIGDTVFLHGGVTNALTRLSIADTNRSAGSDLREYLDLVGKLTAEGALPSTLDYSQRNAYIKEAMPLLKSKRDWGSQAARVTELDSKSLVYSGQGPLWYRGTAGCHPFVAAYDSERVLANWKARRLVLGHTPAPGLRVTSRMDGSVILADTGMLKSAFNGRASALVIENGQVSAQYLGEPGLQPLQPDPVPVPRQPTDMSDAAIEDFLMTAKVVENVDIGTGVTRPRKLTLEKDGKRLNAVYKPYDSDPGLERAKYYTKKHNSSDRYVYDVAAYKLDRLMGVHRVPVSVVRTIGGKPGLVQVWLTNTINERDRVEKKVNFTGVCSQSEQYRLRILWDILVFNEDRNLTNLLWTDDDFTLLLIDHSLSFRGTKGRPKQYASVELEMSDYMRSRLEKLNQAELMPLLSPYLHPTQIEAMLARRDQMLRDARRTGYTY
jgi:hypothetical protein